jgi:hypothetical protein
VRTPRALHCDHPGCPESISIEPPPEPWPTDADGERRPYARGRILQGWAVVTGTLGGHYCPEHAAEATLRHAAAGPGPETGDRP